MNRLAYNMYEMKYAWNFIDRGDGKIETVMGNFGFSIPSRSLHILLGSATNQHKTFGYITLCKGSVRWVPCASLHPVHQNWFTS